MPVSTRSVDDDSLTGTTVKRRERPKSYIQPPSTGFPNLVGSHLSDVIERNTHLGRRSSVTPMTPLTNKLNKKYFEHGTDSKKTHLQNVQAFDDFANAIPAFQPNKATKTRATELFGNREQKTLQPSHKTPAEIQEYYGVLAREFQTA